MMERKTCPSPSPPARRRLRAAASRAHTQGARTRAAGRFLELALRRFSPSPAHSKLGARSKPPLPPRSCHSRPCSGNPPPVPPPAPPPSLQKAALRSPKLSLPHPAPGPVWPNRQEVVDTASELRTNEHWGAGRAAAAGVAAAGAGLRVVFL